MPPVTNQNPANWCFGFSTTDALNYHNYIQTNLQKNKISYENFYTPKNMVSPIDAIYASRLFNDQNTNPLPKIKGRLNMKTGGYPYDIFAGIQMMSYKMRSAEQISFDSNEMSNPSTRAFVQGVIDEYKKRSIEPVTKFYNLGEGLQCPAQIYEHPAFQKQLTNFRQINSWLSATAQLNKWDVGDHIIDNYGAIAALKGEKDVAVYPFINNYYFGIMASSFLSKLKSTLYPAQGYGSPVNVAVCEGDLINQANKTSTNERCEGHAVNVVGAFYEGGKCVVRIRNTWGKNWNGDGHVNLPLDTFLDSLKKVHPEGYMANWITPEITPAPAEPRTSSYGIYTRKTGVVKRIYKENTGSYSETWKNAAEYFDE